MSSVQSNQLFKFAFVMSELVPCCNRRKFSAVSISGGIFLCWCWFWEWLAVFMVEILIYEDFTIWQIYILYFFLFFFPLSFNTVEYFCCPLSATTAFPAMFRVFPAFFFHEINHRGKWEGWRIHPTVESRLWSPLTCLFIREKRDRMWSKLAC